jgi:hypothetical protein
VFETPPVFTALNANAFLCRRASRRTWQPAHVGQPSLSRATSGYFRATKRFFPQPFHPADIEPVAQRLGSLPGLIELDRYDEKATTARQRQVILEYLGFRPFDTQARQDLAREIR